MPMWILSISSNINKPPFRQCETFPLIHLNNCWLYISTSDSWGKWSGMMNLCTNGLLVLRLKKCSVMILLTKFFPIPVHPWNANTSGFLMFLELKWFLSAAVTIFWAICWPNNSDLSADPIPEMLLVNSLSRQKPWGLACRYTESNSAHKKKTILIFTNPCKEWLFLWGAGSDKSDSSEDSLSLFNWHFVPESLSSSSLKENTRFSMDAFSETGG